MIRKKIQNSVVLQHLKDLPEDCRHIMLIADNQVRLTGLSATTMVNQVRENFNLGILETLVLGQAYIASGLMASSVKGNDRIQLAVECGGPIGGIYTESWACGAVRGYIKNNPIPVTKELTSADISDFYGPGFISVTKIIEGSKTPFTGQVMIQYGNLAKDLALYYSESEQTPTLFSLSVNFNKEGIVTGAGGLFMQALPGCSNSTLEKLQDYSTKLPSLGKAISNGTSIHDYCCEVFSNWGVQELAKAPVMFSCPCSRENFATFLSNMPEKEKKEILEDNIYPVELECFNCGTRYSFTKQEITELFK